MNKGLETCITKQQSIFTFSLIYSLIHSNKFGYFIYERHCVEHWYILLKLAYFVLLNKYNVYELNNSMHSTNIYQVSLTLGPGV